MGPIESSLEQISTLAPNIFDWVESGNLSIFKTSNSSGGVRLKNSIEDDIVDITPIGENPGGGKDPEGVRFSNFDCLENNIFYSNDSSQLDS